MHVHVSGAFFFFFVHVREGEGKSSASDPLRPARRQVGHSPIPSAEARSAEFPNVYWKRSVRGPSYIYICYMGVFMNSEKISLIMLNHVKSNH